MNKPAVVGSQSFSLSVGFETDKLHCKSTNILWNVREDLRHLQILVHTLNKMKRPGPIIQISSREIKMELKRNRWSV
jgi:hypothetical protein